MKATPQERKELAKYENVALSDGQLKQILRGKVNIVMYPDIHKMKSLDEVLGPHGAAIILFESKPGYGHWCSLFRGPGRDNGMVEFFNPYGGYPDDSLKLIGRGFAAKTNQDVPYLSRLMIQSPYRLSYNQYPFQRQAGGIRTCGRHCASRLLLRDLTLDQYHDWIVEQARKTGTDADAVVSAITDQVAPA